MFPFYGNLLNSAHGYIQMAIATAEVTKKVRMSRNWKAELVAYRICKQPSPRVVHILPLKLDRSPVCPICPESFSAPCPDIKIWYLSNRALE
jgi:hypothetical protein